MIGSILNGTSIKAQRLICGIFSIESGRANTGREELGYRRSSWSCSSSPYRRGREVIRAPKPTTTLEPAKTLSGETPFCHICHQPGLDQRLVRHVPLVCLDLDAVQQHFRQPQRYGFGRRLQVGEEGGFGVVPIKIIA